MSEATVTFMSDIQENNTKDTAASGDLFSDPAALSSLLSAIKPPAASDTQSSGGAGNILSGLFSDPEMLAKLPAVIETVRPLLQNLSSPTVEKSSENTIKKTNGNDRRVALLLALKPYLSKSRCDAIDYIVKISGITEMFR